MIFPSDMPVRDVEKDSFMSLSLDDKLSALFDMLRYLRKQDSNLYKDVIELRREQKDFWDELRDVRYARERKEEERDKDLMTTTQKIRAIMEAAEAKRFDFWVYARDKVAPQIISMIVIAILVLTFGAP